MHGHRTRRVLLSALALLAAALAACDRSPAPEANVTYTNTIAPLMAERCHACHQEGSPTLAEFEADKDGWKRKGKGPRLDSYELLTGFVNGEDAGAVMRRLDDGKHTKDGKPGNMYVNLGASDTERAANLARFKRWIGEGSWILKKNEDWTDAERKAVKALR